MYSVDVVQIDINKHRCNIGLPLQWKYCSSAHISLFHLPSFHIK